MYIPGITKTRTIIEAQIKAAGLPAPQDKSNDQISTQKKSEMTEEKQHKILTNAYPSLTETKIFNTTSGELIPATESFVYLGSLIHFTLHDTYDMDRRIVKARQMMGALCFDWSWEEIDLGDKVHIYHVFLLSILLWGAETWAMTETHQKRLKTFHHQSIRSILGLQMERIKEERITNDDVRIRFCKIPTISEIIMKRKLTFIGHIMREWAATSTVITTWLQDKQPRGRPTIVVHEAAT